MSKARDLANAGTALTTVSATELGYLDGVTSAVQTQIDSKEATLPSQTGNSGKYLTTDGSAKSWGTVSQYALPSQTGNAGKFLTTNGTSESWGTVSQPITFTHKFTHTASLNFNNIATNGSTIIVAVGNSGILYSSVDSGTTWASRTSGFGSNTIYSVAFGNSLFVAVGQNGTITTSSDGITWTARTAGVSTNQLNYVTYQNNLWVAVGNGANGGAGGITTSSDGITWTKRNTPTTSATGLTSVSYGGGYWVAVGYFNTRAGYYSTDGITWTVTPASLAADLSNIFYNGTTWITTYSSGNGYYCVGIPSGTWSTINNPPIVYAPVDSSNVSLGIYNSILYYIGYNVLNLPNISRVSTGITGNLMTAYYSQILGPVNSSASNLSYRCMTVDTNGRIWLADSNGRIYTATI